MTIPQLTPVPVGYVAQLADLQAMTSACTFLLGKPISRVHTAIAGQSLPASTFTAINFDTVDFDPDGMWASGNPSRLTVQTPGFYKARYGVCQTGVTATAELMVTTGANNPAGAGVTAPYYDCYLVGHSASPVQGAAGVIPQYMYAADYAQVIFDPASAATVSITSYISFFGLELVSI